MHHLILAAILLLAAYVRLSHLDLGLFMLDQARDLTQALAIAQGGVFPLVGPEVDGGPSHTWGPLHFVLLAVPFAVSPEPAHAAVFLAMLNLLAVYLTYRLGATFFGPDVGLVAAALFAADPGAVASARALWNLAPLPLFTIMFFHGLFAVVVQRRPAMIVLSAAALACLVQLHLATLGLAVVLIVALVMYRPRLSGRHVLIAAGAAVALLLPFLVGQALAGCAELRALLSYSRSQVGPRSPTELLTLAQQTFFASAFLSTLVAREFGSPGFLRVFTALEWAQAWLVLASSAFLVVRMAGAWLRGVPPWSTSVARYGLLVLWISVPCVVMGLKQGRLPWYYFDLLYPAPFVATALVLVDLASLAPIRRLRGGRTLARGAVALLVALVILVQVDFARRWWTVTAATGAPTSTTLHYALVRSDEPDHAGRGRAVAQVGPFDLVEYSPLVDYQSWQYSDDPEGARWTRLPVPTRGAPDLDVYPYPPLFTWRQLPVRVRGEIVAGHSPPPAFRLIVVLREPYESRAHRIEGLELNGQRIPPLAVRLHPTFIARDSETVFDLGGRLREGCSTVTFTVAGEGRTFDIDVYELGG